MRRLFLSVALFLMGSVSWAAGPIYPHDNQSVQREFEEVYNNLSYPTISTGTAQNFTVDNFHASTSTVDVLKFSNGTSQTTAASAAKVIQSTCTVTTTAKSTTSGTFQGTNVTASFSPTSASNKVLVVVTMFGEIGSTTLGASARYSIFRNGSTDIGSADASSGFGGIFNYISSLTSNTGDFIAMSILDSPATTSATSYLVVFKTTAGTVHHSRNNEPATMCLYELAI